MSRLFNERVVSSAILLLIGLGLAFSTFGLTFTHIGTAFNPMFFPRIILLLWIALAAANVLADIVANESSEPFRMGRVLIISCAFMVYVIYMRELGFFFSSVALSLVVLAALGVRSLLAFSVVGIGGPLLITLLFGHLLGMPLPNSPFFWWI